MAFFTSSLSARSFTFPVTRSVEKCTAFKVYNEIYEEDAALRVHSTRATHRVSLISMGLFALTGGQHQRK